MKMVRTCLIAATAGVLISPALMAAELSLGKHWIGQSYLGLGGAGDTVTTGSIAVILGAEYAVGDKIRLDFSGGTVDGASFPASVVVPCEDESAAGAGDGLAGVTWGRLNFNADGVTWRITEIDSATCPGATSTEGLRVQFANNFVALFDAPAVLAAGGVTVSFSAETGVGDALDVGGDNRTDSTIDVGSEFDYTVSGFDATIDVNTDRTTLIPGPNDSTSFIRDPFDLSGGPYVNITAVGVLAADITWSGDFGWIVDGNEATPEIDPQNNVVLGPNCNTRTVTASAISGTGCNPFSNFLTVNPSLNTDADGLVTLNPTTYSVKIDQDYQAFYPGDLDPRTGNITTTLASGEWDLNGFQAKVAYMPFQTGISQVIYLANRSAQSGDITVDWIDQNGNSDSFDIGVVNAGSTRAIGPAIRAGLPATQRNGGRLALVITANVPACDAQLNAQYNVSGDRAFSVATTNCPVKAEFPDFDF